MLVFIKGVLSSRQNKGTSQSDTAHISSLKETHSGVMRLHREFIEHNSHPLSITGSLDHLRLQPVQPGRQLTGRCSVFLVGDMEAQGAPQREVCKEGPGHVLDLWVCTLGLEILHVVPEVRGGERPVGHGWWLSVGV